MGSHVAAVRRKKNWTKSRRERDKRVSFFGLYDRPDSALYRHRVRSKLPFGPWEKTTTGQEDGQDDLIIDVLRLRALTREVLRVPQRVCLTGSGRTSSEPRQYSSLSLK